jgi:4-hydroxy-tetrahydrodipicolinate synthase
VASNLVPADVKKVFTLTKEGKLAEANEVQDKLLPVIDACFTEVNPIPVKAGANMLGLNAGVPRGPLTELEEAHKEVMRAALKNYGLEIVE